MVSNDKDFYNVIRSRYSVRRYLKDPIEGDRLNRIIETARLAASAANRQPWSFIICEGTDKERLNQAFYKEGFKDAPVAIAALAHPNKAWIRKEDGRNYSWVDVSIAVTELILAATCEGLASCWIASFDLDKAKKILEVPPDAEIVTLVTLGYPHPDEKFTDKSRKPLEDIVYKGKYKSR